MSKGPACIACFVAFLAWLAHPPLVFGQVGEGATAGADASAPEPDAATDDGAPPVDTTAQPAPDGGVEGAPPEPPLVVAGPGEAEPAPGKDRGQAGQELRDAHYRVKKETDVLTLRRKRKTGVRPPDDLRAGISLAGGSVATPGIEQGWYGRLDFSALQGKRKGLFGGVIGADAGFEYWTSTEGAGGGLPMNVSFGALGPLSHFGIDLGFEFLIDNRDHDLGFGIYAPFARAKLGFDFGPVMILAESQIQYRWQWGADDYTDYRLGLSLRLLGEPPVVPPRDPQPGRNRD